MEAVIRNHTNQHGPPTSFGQLEETKEETLQEFEIVEMDENCVIRSCIDTDL